jgi:hypothetical protein
MKALLAFVIALTLGTFTSLADEAKPPIKPAAKRIPFRIVFDSYTGDRTYPETMSFRVTVIDLPLVRTFLKIGEAVPGTAFNIRSFRYIMYHDPRAEDGDDLSELTLFNPATGEEIVLTHMRIFDLAAPRVPKASATPTPK